MNLPALRQEFNRLLNPIYDRLAALDSRLDSKVSLRDATVTSVNPVRIQFDGDDAPKSSTPEIWVPVGPGDRVRVAHHGGTRYTIAGVVGTAGRPWRMAAGTAVIPASSSPTSTVVVPFPAGRFTDRPIVTTTPRSSHYALSTGVPTAESVTLGARRLTAGNVENFNVAWHAVQMTPTSAEG